MLANKLKKGDTIGVVCPSDKVNDEDIPEIKEAERLLKEKGYNVVFGKNVYKRLISLIVKSNLCCTLGANQLALRLRLSNLA